MVHAPPSLPLGIDTLVPIGLEIGWAPEVVWTWWQREKIPALPGIELWSSNPQPSHYTDQVVPAPDYAFEGKGLDDIRINRNSNLYLPVLIFRPPVG
jgi:hypothetical protein